MDDEAQHYGREDGIVCFFLFSGHVEALQIHILTANIRVNEGLWLIYVSLCWPITKKQITVVLLTKEIEGEMEQWDCVGPLNFFPKSFCNKHTHIYIYTYIYICILCRHLPQIYKQLLQYYTYLEPKYPLFWLELRPSFGGFFSPKIEDKQGFRYILRGSMYGLFTYIYHKNQPNVGKYTIHRHRSYQYFLST